jgi:hypothetical protein
MLILAAILGILIYGIVAATWGTFNPTLGFTNAQIGTLSMAQSIGLVVASISVGPLIDLKGKKIALVGGLAMISISFWMLPAAGGNFTLVLLALVLLGLGGGIVVTGANALVSDVSESRRGSMLNILNLFFGLGGLITPFVTANILGGSAVRMCYVAAVLATVALLVNVITPMPKPTGERGFKASEIGSVVGRPALYMLALFLFLYIACEVGVWNWLARYLIEVRKLDKIHRAEYPGPGLRAWAAGGPPGDLAHPHQCVRPVGHARRFGGHGDHHFRHAAGHQPVGRVGGGVLRRHGDGAHLSHHARPRRRRLPTHERDRHGHRHHLRLARTYFQQPDHRSLCLGDRAAAAARLLRDYDSGEPGPAPAAAEAGVSRHSPDSSAHNGS